MSPLISEDVISRQSPEAQAIIHRVLEDNRRLREELSVSRAEISALRGEIAALRDELAAVGKSPRNSSKPPSTEHPHAKPPSAKPKSKRRRGGQPGHPRHERALIPAEQCAEVIVLAPSACRRCGEKLTGRDPQPLRHQVWELPEIKPIVTEYQRQRLTCPCCGESTCAELPRGVPTTTAGPRLVALVAMLMGCFRQSKRRVALFLEQVLGQPCSAGWVVKLQNQATAALRPAYDRLAERLPDQRQVSIDETPSKEGPTKAWLWTVVARPFTVFALRATRGACVLEELLGESFAGVVNCDRAKAYLPVGATGRLQWCWAHLTRDFQALIDSRDGKAKRLGHDLMRPTRVLFRHWSRCRDGTITRERFKRLMRPIRQEVEGLLLRGVFSGDSRLHGMCDGLWEHRTWLWTFVDHEGVEPTNNASERALRHAVIWRKLSFGTQSAAGSRFVETMLTIVETCRQQGRNLCAFLAKSIDTFFAGRRQATTLLAEA